MTIKSTVKKHTFLLLGSCVVLVVLFLVGYTLSQSVLVHHLLENTPNKNAIELLLWRCSLYLSLFFLWSPLVRHRISKLEKTVSPDKIERLIGYRYKLLVVALVYEVFIVQNLIGWIFWGS